MPALVATRCVLATLVAITGTSPRPAAFIWSNNGRSWWSRSIATTTSGRAALSLATNGAKFVVLLSMASLYSTFLFCLASASVMALASGAPNAVSS